MYLICRTSLLRVNVISLNMLSIIKYRNRPIHHFKKMKRLVLYVAPLSLLFAACHPENKEDSVALAQEQNIENFGTRDDEKDAEFVVTTMERSYAEIKLARLAINQSLDENVKNMAIQIDEGNSNMLNELKDL